MRIYCKNRNGVENKRYWRCENYKSSKCPGTVLTDSDNKVLVLNDHNHGPSPTRIELARIKDNINKAAVTSSLSPRALVSKQLAGISDKAKTELPKLKNLEKTVGRKRYANGQQAIMGKINIKIIITATTYIFIITIAFTKILSQQSKK
uniref:FLYWCH-type domain-containing protein n=1 Tax=Meloidogyne enterolobii TaxID=390850 RepID=A0A6V7XN54_MELEN|nr:unnamed protein product [Meloidogyne enterolobii]